MGKQGRMAQERRRVSASPSCPPLHLPIFDHTMSHGVKRARQSPEAVAARKQKEQAKLNEYISLTDTIFSKKKSEDWSQDAFQLTTRLLQLNPEFYTIWNYRRNIMTKGLFPASTPEQINDLLSTDLQMTTAALKQHPKVYWIWNHRRWCLENVPLGPPGDDHGWRKAHWDRELFVVEKMLDVDARNFHAWGYRRYVLASMPVPRHPHTELDYTTRKIEASFSNFSAWHQRTKVLQTLWDNGELDPVQSREEEFELVHNALYTDPADQSAWLYHRWLIGEGKDRAVVEREMSVIQELLDEQPDSKWCMETLVHYKRISIRTHSNELTAMERNKLADECGELLKRLIELDPARRRRYEEISTDVDSTKL
ncbi:rab-protein geranylgeranyltransferase [Punctularia strigosozonata HHB-11173 SS5]|uniref:rab-protein geranylgeranyltransferase n=1 Tax=Punctularia strigosozonata (strain HHB-11173) TaxID=741275 RepID=UPI000441810B|nr:rab-protein geranylgeranyltransferase [Punctularia strigosozonata HHB-11173 SS5]EIN07715.1 rab-protein geranylgeranyltransferase [Punctularia strigosozonata HHB-11173 SS5]